MKTTSIVCDRCHRQFGHIDAPAGLTLRVERDRTPDPSGNGYVRNFDYFDLCQVCIQHYFDFALEKGATPPKKS